MGIHATMPLPELTEAASVQDALVQYGSLSVSSSENRTWKQGEDIYLSWPSLGTFRVRAGEEITIDPALGIDEAELRPAILGVCMAVLLHQRGLLVLHASASVVGGRAIAFLGDKGWGKSTTNAALHKRGHAFLTDDILAIALQPSPVAYPAFPQMKLWPSAVAALGDEPMALPKLLPQMEKRQLLFEENLCQQAVPLKAIYLLGKGAELSISPLPTSEILGHLFRHSYSGRCGKDLLQRGESAHFLQCMALARQVPFYRLQRPSNLDGLGAIAQAVETHAHA